MERGRAAERFPSEKARDVGLKDVGLCAYVDRRALGHLGISIAAQVREMWNVGQDSENLWFVVWGDEGALGGSPSVGPRGQVAEALRFARSVVPKQRVLPVLLEQNRPWWDRALMEVPDENVTEQPFDRGSAPGILAAVVRALRKDPNAVLVLQSVGVPAPKRSDLFRAVELARREASVVVLPEARRSGLGERQPLQRIAVRPRDLVRAAEGQLIVVRASVLLELYRAACPDLVSELDKVAIEDGPHHLDSVFPFLPDMDLLAHVLAPAPQQLCLLA